MNEKGPVERPALFFWAKRGRAGVAGHPSASKNGAELLSAPFSLCVSLKL
jgi:hypothetical protein